MIHVVHIDTDVVDFFLLSCVPLPALGHICDVMLGLLEEEYSVLKKNRLCYSSVYYYNCAQGYEQFLQVGRLSGFDLAWFSYVFPAPLSLPFNERSLEGFPLTWLTNHRPSVLWHCWLGHLTRKIFSEMTYNVSSEMLNPATPTLPTLPRVPPLTN